MYSKVDWDITHDIYSEVLYNMPHIIYLFTVTQLISPTSGRSVKVKVIVAPCCELKLSNKGMLIEPFVPVTLIVIPTLSVSISGVVLRGKDRRIRDSTKDIILFKI